MVSNLPSRSGEYHVTADPVTGTLCLTVMDDIFTPPHRR